MIAIIATLAFTAVIGIAGLICITVYLTHGASDDN